VAFREAALVGGCDDGDVRAPSSTGALDLLVACDGANSSLRRQQAAALGPTEVVGRNRYVWLGTPRAFDTFTFAFIRTDAGHLWMHAYGFTRDRSTCIVECTPETWTRLGFDRLSIAQSLQLLERIFADQLDGHPLMVHARNTDTMPWQTFRTVTNRRWYRGKVVLVGDAAHTTHFTIGSGTKLAMEDAIALASALRRHDDLPSALTAYETPGGPLCCSPRARRPTAPVGSSRSIASPPPTRGSSRSCCTDGARSCSPASPRPHTAWRAVDEVPPLRLLSNRASTWRNRRHVR
jgi:hypothetical protein